MGSRSWNGVVLALVLSACSSADPGPRPESEQAAAAPIASVEVPDLAALPELSIDESIPVGEAPIAVTVGHDSVWVANSVGNSVSRIDPQRHRVVAEVKGFPPSSGLYSIASTDDGVWVGASESGSLIKIDPDTNKISKRIKLEGVHTLAGAGDTLWVTVYPEHLLRVDGESGRVQQEIPTGEDGAAGHGVGPTAVRVGSDGVVWVVNWIDNSVAAVDPASDTTTDVIPVEPLDAKQLAVGDSAVWVSHPDYTAVSRVDVATRAQTTTVRFPEGYPFFLATGEASVWVSAEAWLIQLDPDTGNPMGAVRLMSKKELARQEDERAGSQGLATGFGSVWVTDWDENEVHVLSL
jgi:DNA-binding beta-propeller fold protein YncE